MEIHEQRGYRELVSREVFELFQNVFRYSDALVQIATADSSKVKVNIDGVDPSGHVLWGHHKARNRVAHIGLTAKEIQSELHIGATTSNVDAGHVLGIDGWIERDTLGGFFDIVPALIDMGVHGFAIIAEGHVNDETRIGTS